MGLQSFSTWGVERDNLIFCGLEFSVLILEEVNIT